MKVWPLAVLAGPDVVLPLLGRRPGSGEAEPENVTAHELRDQDESLFNRDSRASAGIGVMERVVAAAVVWIVRPIPGRRRTFRQPAEDRRTGRPAGGEVQRLTVDPRPGARPRDGEDGRGLHSAPPAEQSGALGIIRELEDEAEAEAEIQSARARLGKK